MNPVTRVTAQSVQTEPTPVEIRALKKRVTSGYNAYYCCRNSRYRGALNVLQFSELLQTCFDEMPKILQAGVGTIVYPSSQTASSAIVGARFVDPISQAFMILLVEKLEELGEVSLPQTSAALQMVRSFLLRASETVRRGSSGDCYRCVTSRLMTQRKKRVWGRFVSKSTGRSERVQKRIPS